MRNLFYFLAISIVFFGCKSDDEIVDIPTGNLEVKVLLENNIVLKGVVISTEPAIEEKTTNESGIALFENIAEGNYKVFAKVFADSKNYETDVTIRSNQTTSIDIIVDEPNTIDPDPIDINLLLHSVYAGIKGSYFFDATGYSLYWGDSGTDISYVNPSKSSVYIDFDTYDISPTNQLIEQVWNKHYEIIDNINLGLEMLENLDSVSNSNINKDVTTGEFKFLRALLYFNLVKLYGYPVLMIDRGVDISNPPGNVQNIEEVYQLIIEDLTIAEEKLESLTPSYRASIPAAQALLGKVYMQMAGFPLLQRDKYVSALAQFKKIEGLYALEPNYEDVFSLANESSNTEVIFKIGFEGDEMGSGGNYSVLWGPLGVAIDDILLLTSEFTQRYVKNPDDIKTPVIFPLTIEDTRFIQNIATFTIEGDNVINNEDTNNWRPYKFKKENTIPSLRDSESFDYPYLRYADILLMIAEAENEINGPTQAAYEAINQVRRRAFGNTNNDLLPGLTQQEFLDAVLKERSLELCYEGHRKDDLIRTQKLEAVIAAFNIDNPSGVKDYQSYEYIWPIPQRQVLLNPNIVQNQGY